MEILKLSPAFKDNIWGGQILKKEYNVTNMDRVAEAWILSAHKDGVSTVAGGEFDGKYFTYALEKMGKAALGVKCDGFEFFPQLIKFIDAEADLSVQVHPSDDYALKNEGQYGKTEMWYILDAKDGAGIYYGFKDSITKEEFENCINNNTLTDVMQFVPVKKGECYFIPSGTLHAIGKNTLIAEIQQNSNVTYRIYDYGRLGADGKPRELHVEKAKEVTLLCKAEKNNIGNAEEYFDGTKLHLADCKYFSVDKLDINGHAEWFCGDSFTAVIIISGSGKINGIEFKKNDTFFVPAGTLAEFDGEFEALTSTM